MSPHCTGGGIDPGEGLISGGGCGGEGGVLGFPCLPSSRAVNRPMAVMAVVAVALAAAFSRSSSQRGGGVTRHTMSDPSPRIRATRRRGGGATTYSGRGGGGERTAGARPKTGGSPRQGKKGVRGKFARPPARWHGALSAARGAIPVPLHTIGL